MIFSVVSDFKILKASLPKNGMSSLTWPALGDDPERFQHLTRRPLGNSTVTLHEFHAGRHAVCKRPVWCALLLFVQLFGLHHRFNDFRQDGFKQGNFVG
jgi:hypothetical protein